DEADRNDQTTGAPAGAGPVAAAPGVPGTATTGTDLDEPEGPHPEARPVVVGSGGGHPADGETGDVETGDGATADGANGDEAPEEPADHLAFVADAERVLDAV